MAGHSQFKNIMHRKAAVAPKAHMKKNMGSCGALLRK